MPTFNGSLNQNIIQSAIFNMIISQDVLSGSINHTYNLVDKARVDGGLYGDTKLYYDVPTLTSSAWGNDAEAANLLALDRPEAPKVQAIKMGVYRQVRLTKDDYLSKQAFATEGAFATYHSVLSARMQQAKGVYDNTTYNAFFGTVQGGAPTHLLEVPLSDITETGEEKSRIEASMIAEALANLIDDMADYNTKYTANQFLRAFDKSEIKIVWNTKFVNKIEKRDLPTVFHDEKVFKAMFSDKLPSRYFGEVNAQSKVADDSTRSLIEQVIDGTHYFAGDKIVAGKTAPAGTSYQEDEDVICKVYTKLPPYMSAFEVGTSFHNARSLTTNFYLTWGHNNLEAFADAPLVTVHAD